MRQDAWSGQTSAPSITHSCRCSYSARLQTDSTGWKTSPAGKDGKHSPSTQAESLPGEAPHSFATLVHKPQVRTGNKSDPKPSRKDLVVSSACVRMPFSQPKIGRAHV